MFYSLPESFINRPLDTITSHSSSCSSFIILIRVASSFPRYNSRRQRGLVTKHVLSKQCFIAIKLWEDQNQTTISLNRCCFGVYSHVTLTPTLKNRQVDVLDEWRAWDKCETIGFQPSTALKPMLQTNHTITIIEPWSWCLQDNYMFLPHHQSCWISTREGESGRVTVQCELICEKGDTKHETCQISYNNYDERRDPRQVGGVSSSWLLLIVPI